MNTTDLSALNLQPGEEIRIYIDSYSLPYEGWIVDVIENMLIWESAQNIVQGKNITEVLRIERVRQDNGGWE